MDQRSPTFEATLLLKATPKPEFEALLEDVAAVIDSYGDDVAQIEKVDHEHYLFHGALCKVLLAIRSYPLSVDGLMRAGRPTGDAGRALSDNDLLTQILEMNASVTVLVVPEVGRHAPLPGANTAALEQLCWDVSDCVHVHLGSAFVFWGQSDMLYLSDEFEREAPPPVQFTKSDRSSVAFARTPEETLASAPKASEDIRAWFEDGTTDTASPTTLCEPTAPAPARGLFSLSRIAMACTAATVSMSNVSNATHLLL